MQSPLCSCRWKMPPARLSIGRTRHSILTASGSVTCISSREKVVPSPFIDFHRPSIGPEEFEAVRQVLESRWLTTGPVAQQFEREFADYIGCKHALAVN